MQLTKAAKPKILRKGYRSGQKHIKLLKYHRGIEYSAQTTIPRYRKTNIGIKNEGLERPH